MSILTPIFGFIKSQTGDNIGKTIGEDLPANWDKAEQLINSFADQVVSEKVEVTSTDDATSVTDAPLKSAGGLAVAKNVYLNNARLLKIDGGVCFVKGSSFNREYGFGFSTVDANKRVAFVFQLSRGQPYLMQIAVGGGESGTDSLSRVKCIKKDISFRLAWDRSINSIVEHTGLISGFDETDVYIEVHPIDVDKIILYIENNSAWTTRLTPNISIQGGAFSAFVESYIEDIPV